MYNVYICRHVPQEQRDANISREKSNVVPKERDVSRTLVVAAINSCVSEIHGFSCAYTKLKI